MPAPLNITYNGKPIAEVTLTPNDAGKPFVVTGGKPGTYKTVHVYSDHRKTPRDARIEPEKNGQYRLPNPLPATLYRVSVRDQGEDKGEVIEFRVKATDQSPDNSGGGKDSETPVTGWPLGFGACSDADDLANGSAAKLAALGVTHVRSFGSSARDNGEYKGNDAATAAKIIAAGVIPVIRFGISEAKYDKATRKLIRPAVPLTEAQLHVYWRGVAEATKGVPELVWELENESNANNYLGFGQDGGKVSMAVVKYDTLSAKIARQYAGKSRCIVGSTVGWNASARIHIDYVKAKLDAGMYDYADIVGDHAYPDGGASMLEDQLGGIRAIIGDKPFWLTETADKRNPSLDGIAELLPVYRRHKVVPFWFRGEAEQGEPRWSDPWSILDAAGRVNGPVCKVLGLKVAA